MQQTLTEARCGIWLQLGPCCTGVSLGRGRVAAHDLQLFLSQSETLLERGLFIETRSPNFVTSQAQGLQGWDGQFPLPVAAWEKKRKDQVRDIKGIVLLPTDSGEARLRSNVWVAICMAMGILTISTLTKACQKSTE